MKANLPVFFDFRCFVGFFKCHFLSLYRIRHVAVCSLMDCRIFGLMSKPVPKYRESRDKYVLTQLSTAVLIHEDYSEKFFLLPPSQILILKPITKRKYRYQNNDFISSCGFFTCQLSEFAKFQFPDLMG